MRAVALAEGVDVRKLSRSAYILKGNFGFRFERVGTWCQVRMLAALEEGEPPTERDPKESEGARQEIAYARKLERQIGRAEWFLDRLDSALARAIERQPIVAPAIRKPRSLKKKEARKRLVNMFSSDTHFGAGVDPREVPGSEYSWQTACRRLAFFAEQVADYKREHREHSRLAVVMGGDHFEGAIHTDDQLIDPLAAQVIGTGHAYTSVLGFLLEEYPDIDVYMTEGNHGRFPHKGHGRAIAQKHDGLDSILYWGIEQAFRGREDIRFHRSRSPFISYHAPGGQLVVVTHGDTSLTVGNPHSAINVKRAQERINALQVSGMFGERISVVLMGHVHLQCKVILNAGMTLATNGAMIGGNSYSQNALGTYSPTPSQLIFESVDRYAFGDSRDVFFGEADGRSDLNDIVPVPDIF